MIQFHLITGFLGSGKTTFLKDILPQLSKKRNVAVIQNEFASTGIDGKELKQANTSLKVVEINNGSVFCVCQLTNFVQTVTSLIADYELDEIFLETSGMADPISIVELLQSERLRSNVALGEVITLVDGRNYFKGLSGLVRCKHQVMIADRIVVNKSDLVGSEALEKIDMNVKKLNPYADVSFTSYGKFDWQSVVDSSKVDHQAANRFVGVKSGGRPEMQAIVLRVHDKLSRGALSEFLKETQLKSIRIKGFVNLLDGSLVSVHSVFETIEIKEIADYKGPTELVVFSDKLSFLDLRKRFRAFVEMSKRSSSCC